MRWRLAWVERDLWSGTTRPHVRTFRWEEYALALADELGSGRANSPQWVIEDVQLTEV